MTDAPALQLTVDGEARTTEPGTTAAELYA